MNYNLLIKPMSKYVDNSKNKRYTKIRTFVRLTAKPGRGIIKMSITKNEMELLNILSENDNPEEALMTAIRVFSAFVEQLEEAPMLQAAVLQESF